MEKIRILVATHKKYWFPKMDLYMPIELGRCIKSKNNNIISNIIGDNIGDNISVKQPYYSELTALYWGWKNLDCDYLGINHYRRYFKKNSNSFFRDPKKDIFTDKDFRNILEKTDVILPKKRNYYFINRFQHYKYQHDIQDLLKCREIIQEFYPEYLNCFDKEMCKKSGHICNMFVMKKEILDVYCEWLFSILFKLENKINLRGRNEYQQRVLGYIAERLLDVWLTKNSIKYLEVDYINIEGFNICKKILKLFCNIFLFYYKNANIRKM